MNNTAQTNTNGNHANLNLAIRQDLDAAVRDLTIAMNKNNAISSSPYLGYEVTESRPKYHLLNSVLTNGQRSGLFLIDRNTLIVYKCTSYGKTAKRSVGTVASLTAQFNAATLTHR